MSRRLDHRSFIHSSRAWLIDCVVVNGLGVSCVRNFYKDQGQDGRDEGRDEGSWLHEDMMI